MATKISTSERARMIIDLPVEAQMAIKIRAVKLNATAGEVVLKAISQVFGTDIEDARVALAEQAPSHRSTPKKDQKS